LRRSLHKKIVIDLTGMRLSCRNFKFAYLLTPNFLFYYKAYRRGYLESEKHYNGLCTVFIHSDMGKTTIYKIKELMIIN